MTFGMFMLWYHYTFDLRKELRRQSEIKVTVL
jgi:hypothetical protein